MREVFADALEYTGKKFDIFHLVAHQKGLYFRDNSLGCQQSSRFERFYTDGHEKMVILAMGVSPFSD